MAALLVSACTSGGDAARDAPRPERIARIRELLEPYGVERTPEPTVLSATLIEDGALLREELEFTTFDGLVAFAVRLSPNDDARHPGVLFLHGHDESSDALTKPTKGASSGMALALTKAGFVTLSPDIRSWGRFRPHGLGHYGPGKYVEDLRARGQFYLRETVNDARVALSVLAASPHVEPLRIGLAGLSLGGLIAMLTTVSEPSVKATAISNILIPFEMYFTDKHHNCGHMPPLRQVGESYEILAEVLPRALMIQWGEQDAFYGKHRGKEATAKLAALAKARGHESSLEVRVSPGIRHAYEPTALIAFFAKRL